MKDERAVNDTEEYYAHRCHDGHVAKRRAKAT